MKSPEIGSSEQNKGEQIASKMYGILDRVKQPKNYETLNNAANEFASESYDKGQRILEKNGFWHDTVREVAVEANQAERGKKGNIPLSLAEAKNAIKGYAKSLAESGTKEDKESALEIQGIVLNIADPDMKGIDGALNYIEGVLQTKALLERVMKPEMKKQWEEQRNVRDALFIEKQRRIKESEQKQTVSEGSMSEDFTEIIEKSKKRDKEELATTKEYLAKLFGKPLNTNEKAPEKLPTNLESGVPLFITKKLRKDLKSFEVTDEEIDELKPEEAWELLKNKLSEEERKKE